VEEEQVGLCEPGKNDEDPSSFAGISWYNRSDESVARLEQQTGG
jgi:hypothetical protein